MNSDTRAFIAIIITGVMWFNFMILQANDSYSYNSKSGRDAVLPESFYYGNLSILFINFQVFAPVIVGLIVFKVLPK